MECTTDGCTREIKNKKRGLCARCYQYWLQTDAPHKPRCPVEGCQRPTWCKGLCNIHYRTGGEVIVKTDRPGRGAPGKTRGLRNLGGRYITQYGYVKIRRFDVIGRSEWVLEHRHVMEQHLGRMLLSSENVHHIDGNKENNKLENLELWVKHQPTGQRVTDLVTWAIEVLERYKPDALHV